MDGRTFDGLVKSLSIATSRRGLLGGAAATVATLVTGRVAAQDKVTICHFTGSATNPYNLITISTNALDQHVANHGDFVFTDCCLDAECGELTDQCNIGVCDEGTCIAVPQTGAACDDGNFCTENDTCDATGACAGTAVDCSALDDDCNVGVCDAADGSCFAQAANEGGACADDGDVCTTDTCLAGTCMHGAIEGCCLTNDDCPEDLVCIDNECTEDPNPECAGATCTTFIECSSENPDCVCTSLFSGGGFCVPGSTPCPPLTPCPNGNECADDELCAVNTCCEVNVCIPIDLECVLGFTSSRAAAPGEENGLTVGGR